MAKGKKKNKKKSEKKKGAKPSTELIASLKALAKGVGKKLDEIKEEFQAVVKEKYLQDLAPQERLEMAGRVLVARYAERYAGDDNPYQFIVLDVGHPRPIAVKDDKGKPIPNKKQDFAQIFGIFLPIGEDEEEIGDPEYGQVDLYREATKISLQVKRGQAYQGNFTGSAKQGTYRLGTKGDKVPIITELDDIPIEKFDARRWVLDRFGDPVDIISASENLSENPSDKKIIQGQVSGSWAGKGRSGYPFGRYNMIDDSMDFDDIKKTGGLSVMVAHNQIRWAVGSEVLHLGILEDDDQYGIGLSGEVVLEKFGIPKPKIDIEKYKEDEKEDEEEPEEDNEPEGDEEPEEDEEPTEDETEGDEDEDIDLSGLD